MIYTYKNIYIYMHTHYTHIIPIHSPPFIHSFIHFITQSKTSLNLFSYSFLLIPIFSQIFLNPYPIFKPSLPLYIYSPSLAVSIAGWAPDNPFFADNCTAKRWKSREVNAHFYGLVRYLGNV